MLLPLLPLLPLPLLSLLLPLPLPLLLLLLLPLPLLPGVSPVAATAVPPPLRRQASSLMAHAPACAREAPWCMLSTKHRLPG